MESPKKFWGEVMGETPVEVGGEVVESTVRLSCVMFKIE